jgi:hypothetical protein
MSTLVTDVLFDVVLMMEEKFDDAGVEVLDIGIQPGTELNP